MRAVLFVVLLASTARAADVPFYLRQIDGPRDVSAINENFRSIVNDLTKLRADIDAVDGADSNSNSNFTDATATVTITANFNGCVWISSQDIVSSGISYATITIPSGQWGSSQTWRIEWSVRHSSAMPWMAWVVNGLTNLNYKDSCAITWNGDTYRYSNGTAGMGIYFLNTNNSTIGDTGFGYTSIRTNLGDTRIHSYTDGTWYYSGPSGLRISCGGTYTAAGGPISSVTLVGTSAGSATVPTGNRTFTAHLELWRCGQKAG